MKNKTQFVCNQCGCISPKWVGKCEDCGQWNTFEENLLSSHSISARAGFNNNFGRTTERAKDAQAHFVPLSEVEQCSLPRIYTGLPEFDRVLGGGLVPGSLLLLSGDPGIGKSTLLLQALFGLASRGYKVIYASGEESPEQIRLRADRMQCVHANIIISSTTNVVQLLEAALQRKPHILVVDSIQTVHHPEIASSPGSVSQVRESAATLLEFAKKATVSTLLVGHVTKEGNVAGPKILEHLVDAVMHLEGDANTGFRILRNLKNRFGSTGEIGVFAMQGNGLKEVGNPSLSFLGESHNATTANSRGGKEGSAVGVCLEGTRPLLVEIQALVGRSTYASPRRVANGLDLNRTHILVAILEKRAGVLLSLNDLFVGAAGGLRVQEPAIDLALAAAILSSFMERAVPQRHAFLGEIGLSGEVRPVLHASQRVNEALKFGFERIYLPSKNFQNERKDLLDMVQKSGADAQLFPIEDVRELKKLFT